MKLSRQTPKRLLIPLAAVAALIAPTFAAAAERTLTFDAARTEVSFDLPATGHDVHGLIALREGVLRFDDASGMASGEIVLEAASAASGNDSRDKTMREEVLEVATFPEIRFIAESIQGTLPENGIGEIRLVGRIRIHGADHPQTLVAKVTTRGTHLSATTEFPVAFLDWGMKDPSILFLRVEPVVTVRVQAQGELAGGDVVAGGA